MEEYTKELREVEKEEERVVSHVRDVDRPLGDHPHEVRDQQSERRGVEKGLESV